MKSTEKIVVGWIDSGFVHSGFIAHLSNILVNRSEQLDGVVVASGPYLSLNRNRMASLFLNTGADWLLSLDSDVCITLETFDKLVAAADSETRPVMGGKYYLPFEDGKVIVLGAQDWVDRSDPHALGRWLTKEEASIALNSGTPILEKLHSTGIGFTLIHREVLLAVQALNSAEKYPWFKDSYSEEWDTWTSDDIYFWEQCRILGINISINLEANSEHLKQFKLNDDVYMTNNPDMLNFEPAVSYALPQKRTSWWTRSKKR